MGEDKEQGGPAVGTAGQAKINSDKLCWGGAVLEELGYPEAQVALAEGAEGEVVVRAGRARFDRPNCRVCPPVVDQGSPDLRLVLQPPGLL